MPIKKDEEDIEDLVKRIKQHYKKNKWFLFVTSFVFLFSFLLPCLLPSPTYMALGSLNLRIADLKKVDILQAIMILFLYAGSLFLFSIAVTNINLMIKAKRTLSSVSEEMVKGIVQFAWKIFFVYLCASLISVLLIVVTYNTTYYIIGILLSLLVFALIFFVPPAIAIDGYSIKNVFIWSVRMLINNWHLVIIWIFTTALILITTEWIVFAIFSPEVGKYVVPIVNAFFFLPFLTFLQSEIYLTKYPLSPP